MKKLNSKIIGFIIFIMITFMSFGQSNEVLKNLKGKWVSYKKVDSNGEDGKNITLTGKPYDIDIKVIFLDKGKSIFIERGKKYNINFRLKKNVLSIGNRKYTIKKITSTKLILKEEKLLGGFVYFRKAKK